MTAADVEVAHGYTMADLHRIARTGITAAFSRGGDGEERYRAAWDGVVDALCAAGAEAPTERELVYAAANAVDARNQTDEKHRPDGANGIAYWDALARPTPGHERIVVERVALGQILPRLGDTDRQALAALAACGTYSRAAAALGIPYFTFMTRIRRARTKFLAAWHEGETPPRMWRMDIRERKTDRWAGRKDSGSGGGSRSDLLRRHGRVKIAAMPDHGTWARYDYHACRCVPCAQAALDHWRGRRERRRAAKGLPPVDRSGAEHGTMRRYRQGCGCEPCRAACREKTRAYRAGKAGCPVLDRTDAERRREDLLRLTLRAAVPLWLEERRSWPAEILQRRARECSQVIGAEGDVLMFGGKVGGAGRVFDHLAEGMACALLAGVDGGMEFLGVRWHLDCAGRLRVGKVWELGDPDT